MPLHANDNFAALRAYRNAPQHVPGPLQSNWSLVASDVPDLGDDARAEDKADGAAAPRWTVEKRHEIVPSIEGMFRALGEPTRVYVVTQRGIHGPTKPVVYREWTRPRASIQKWNTPKYRNGTTTGRHVVRMAALAKESITEWGKLHFSNGETTERHMARLGDGSIALAACEMPEGALLGCKVEATKPRGSSGAAGMPNGKFIEWLVGENAPNHAFIPKGEMRPKEFNLTAAQSRANLAAAIDNTQVMPPVTICPPGVAAGTSRYSQQFVGTRTVSTKGKGGAIGWVDFYTADRDRAQLQKAIAALSEKSRAVLDAALTAANLIDVGVAAGQSREYARSRGGALALTAANDNFADEIKKLA